MAPLLAGDEAVAAAHKLMREAPYVTAVGHPQTQDRSQRFEMLALAHARRSILIDAGRTPALASLIAQCPLLGSLDGQALGHGLLQTFAVLPERFACANIAHALISGDVCLPQTLARLQAIYMSPEPAPSETSTSTATHAPTSLAEFARGAQDLALLLDTLSNRLRQMNLTKVSRLEAAAVSPIVRMEHNGMPVDRQTLLRRLEDEAQRMVQLARELTQRFGAPITLESSDEVLLAAVNRGPHSLSSLSEANIRTLAPALAKPLMEFTLLRRLSRTVGARFAEHIRSDGRIHSHFVQIGARSGRMSCTRPNLQAITLDPSRRACFRAPAGHVLIMGDYAACELRILADMSEDEALCSAIGQGADLHAGIASRMFGTEVSKTLRPELRAAAKTIAFGLIYGMGAQALSVALDKTRQAAEALMAQFFAAFPRVQDHLESQSLQALQLGYATTRSGRRCRLDTQSSGRAPDGLRRMARNLPIQGTSADIIKVALARIHASLAQTKGRALVHCIHDEIILTAPQEEAQDAVTQLQTAMQGAGDGLLVKIPLVADVHAGVDWQGH